MHTITPTHKPHTILFCTINQTNSVNLTTVFHSIQYNNIICSPQPRLIISFSESVK